jgi:hypothetical protein
MENLKIKVLTKPNINQEEKNKRIETIENATTSLKSTLLRLQKKNSVTPWHLRQKQDGLNMVKN